MNNYQPYQEELASSQPNSPNFQNMQNLQNLQNYEPANLDSPSPQSLKYQLNSNPDLSRAQQQDPEKAKLIKQIVDDIVSDSSSTYSKKSSSLKNKNLSSQQNQNQYHFTVKEKSSPQKLKNKQKLTKQTQSFQQNKRQINIRITFAQETNKEQTSQQHDKIEYYLKTLRTNLQNITNEAKAQFQEAEALLIELSYTPILDRSLRKPLGELSILLSNFFVQQGKPEESYLYLTAAEGLMEYCEAPTKANIMNSLSLQLFKDQEISKLKENALKSIYFLEPLLQQQTNSHLNTSQQQASPEVKKESDFKIQNKPNGGKNLTPKEKKDQITENQNQCKEEQKQMNLQYSRFLLMSYYYHSVAYLKIYQKRVSTNKPEKKDEWKVTKEYLRRGNDLIKDYYLSTRSQEVQLFKKMKHNIIDCREQQKKREKELKAGVQYSRNQSSRNELRGNNSNKQQQGKSQNQSSRQAQSQRNKQAESKFNQEALSSSSSNSESEGLVAANPENEKYRLRANKPNQNQQNYHQFNQHGKSQFKENDNQENYKNMAQTTYQQYSQLYQQQMQQINQLQEHQHSQVIDQQVQQSQQNQHRQESRPRYPQLPYQPSIDLELEQHPYPPSLPSHQILTPQEFQHYQTQLMKIQQKNVNKIIKFAKKIRKETEYNIQQLSKNIEMLQVFGHESNLDFLTSSSDGEQQSSSRNHKPVNQSNQNQGQNQNQYSFQQAASQNGNNSIFMNSKLSSNQSCDQRGNPQNQAHNTSINQQMHDQTANFESLTEYANQQNNNVLSHNQGQQGGQYRPSEQGPPVIVNPILPNDDSITAEKVDSMNQTMIEHQRKLKVPTNKNNIYKKTLIQQQSKSLINQDLSQDDIFASQQVLDEVTSPVKQTSQILSADQQQSQPSSLTQQYFPQFSPQVAPNNMPLNKQLTLNSPQLSSNSQISPQTQIYQNMQTGSFTPQISQQNNQNQNQYQNQNRNQQSHNNNFSPQLTSINENLNSYNNSMMANDDSIIQNQEEYNKQLKQMASQQEESPELNSHQKEHNRTKPESQNLNNTVIMPYPKPDYNKPKISSQDSSQRASNQINSFSSQHDFVLNQLNQDEQKYQDEDQQLSEQQQFIEQKPQNMKQLSFNPSQQFNHNNFTSQHTFQQPDQDLGLSPQMSNKNDISHIRLDEDSINVSVSDNQLLQAVESPDGSRPKPKSRFFKDQPTNQLSLVMNPMNNDNNQSSQSDQNQSSQLNQKDKKLTQHLIFQAVEGIKSEIQQMLDQKEYSERHSLSYNTNPIGSQSGYPEENSSKSQVAFLAQVIKPLAVHQKNRMEIYQIIVTVSYKKGELLLQHHCARQPDEFSSARNDNQNNKEDESKDYLLFENSKSIYTESEFMDYIQNHIEDYRLYLPANIGMSGLQDFMTLLKHYWMSQFSIKQVQNDNSKSQLMVVTRYKPVNVSNQSMSQNASIDKQIAQKSSAEPHQGILEHTFHIGGAKLRAIINYSFATNLRVTLFRFTQGLKSQQSQLGKLSENSQNFSQTGSERQEICLVFELHLSKESFESLFYMDQISHFSCFYEDYIQGNPIDKDLLCEPHVLSYQPSSQISIEKLNKMFVATLNSLTEICQNKMSNLEQFNLNYQTILGVFEDIFTKPQTTINKDLVHWCFVRQTGTSIQMNLINCKTALMNIDSNQHTKSISSQQQINPSSLSYEQQVSIPFIMFEALFGVPLKQVNQIEKPYFFVYMAVSFLSFQVNEFYLHQSAMHLLDRIQQEEDDFFYNLSQNPELSQYIKQEKQGTAAKNNSFQSFLCESPKHWGFSTSFFRRFFVGTKYKLPLQIEMIYLFGQIPVGLKTSSYSIIRSRPTGCFLTIEPNYWLRDNKELEQGDILKDFLQQLPYNMMIGIHMLQVWGQMKNEEVEVLGEKIGEQDEIRVSFFENQFKPKNFIAWHLAIVNQDQQSLEGEMLQIEDYQVD